MSNDSLRERIAQAMWERQHNGDGAVWPRDADHPEWWREDADAALAAIEALLEAMRRHIRSYEPGTLFGSELCVAKELRTLDGEIWEPWCRPGDPADNMATEFADLVEMVEASGTHVVVPVESR